MSNTYFRFKKFTIEQDRTAMKVCTDSCLFGAWTAANLKDAVHVLDIGTGTGLLALMYAQQNQQSLIDAVEIDVLAAGQARGNFQASPWSERLTVHHCPVKEFRQHLKYDLIICNPPFYDNDLPASEEARNMAMHGTSLRLEELREYIDYLSTPNAKLVVLLPYHRAGYFTDLVKPSGWQLFSGLSVKQSPKHSFFRSILCFSKLVIHSPEEKELVIKDPGDTYSDDFTGLLKDYYLYL